MPSEKVIKEKRFRDEFARQLREQLERRTKTDVAERLGVSRISLDHYLKRKKTPSGFILTNAAAFLSIDLRSIMNVVHGTPVKASKPPARGTRNPEVFRGEKVVLIAREREHGIHVTLDIKKPQVNTK